MKRAPRSLSDRTSGDHSKGEPQRQRAARSAVSRCLRRIVQFLDETSEEELSRFIEGSLKLALVEVTSDSTSRNLAKNVELETFVLQLQATTTRDEAADMLTPLGKQDLAQLARILHLHTNKQDNREVLQDKIVEAVIGVRLRSEAIQGINLKVASRRVDQLPELRSNERGEGATEPEELAKNVVEGKRNSTQ